MEVLMEKLLTVVVPSYNVEKYLEETLESFVIPEIMDDLEVLIVNDGSKDRTPEIGAAYEKRYPQTFRLISKENGGHGSTINRGIEEAKGTYFKVVDGDDWVDRGGFTELLHRLKTSGADYVVTDYYKVNDGTKEKKLETFPYLKAHPKCRFEEVVGNTDILMHALVIRTAILKENGISTAFMWTMNTSHFRYHLWRRWNIMRFRCICTALPRRHRASACRDSRNISRIM